MSGIVELGSLGFWAPIWRSFCLPSAPRPGICFLGGHFCREERSWLDFSRVLWSISRDEFRENPMPFYEVSRGWGGFCTPSSGRNIALVSPFQTPVSSWHQTSWPFHSTNWASFSAAWVTSRHCALASKSWPVQFAPTVNLRVLNQLPFPQFRFARCTLVQTLAGS